MSRRVPSRLVYGNDTFPSKSIPYRQKTISKYKKKQLFFENRVPLFFPNSVNRSLFCSYKYNLNYTLNDFFCFLLFIYSDILSIFILFISSFCFMHISYIYIYFSKIQFWLFFV